MRKLLKPVVLVLFFLVTGTFAWRTFTGYTEKQKIIRARETLPAAGFTSLRGDQVNLHDFGNLKPIIIIYFHPECEHCRYEAAEIGQHAGDFDKCQLVMVTPDDSLLRIEAFCEQTHLWEIGNIEILTDKRNSFHEVFGKTAIPSVFIYNTKRKLVRYFTGETKTEAIINAIIQSK
jgi:peroxiredoxin